MRVLLVFRSGAQTVVDVEKLAVTKAEVTAEDTTERISRIQWNNAASGDRLLGVVPSEVVAAVELGAVDPVGLQTQPPEVDDQLPAVPDGHTYRELYKPDVTHPDHPGVDCATYEASEATR